MFNIKDLISLSKFIIKIQIRLLVCIFFADYVDMGRIIDKNSRNIDSRQLFFIMGLVKYQQMNSLIEFLYHWQEIDLSDIYWKHQSIL